MKTLTARLPGLFALSFLVAGCAGTPDEEGGVSEGALAASAPATLNLALTIAESKVVFSSRTESFAVNDGTAAKLPCRDRAFHLSSKASLYDAGWTPDAAPSFAESVPGARFHQHTFASCRTGDVQVLGWFGQPRDLELTVSEQLLDEDYDPRQLPLLLQREAVGSGAATFYACDSAFEKKVIGETENARRFEISVACRQRSAPTKGERGPVDFITSPGPYAAVASYREWMLPAVPATDASFARVREALLAKVPEGAYGGAMSTLGKLCDLTIDATATGLTVDHTIVSSARTRHLELTAADLLGFAEGDVFEDPIRVGGPVQGRFAAAEFRDPKGGSFVLRFEENASLDAKVVRINGPEAYCRRLVAK